MPPVANSRRSSTDMDNDLGSLGDLGSLCLRVVPIAMLLPAPLVVLLGFLITGPLCNRFRGQSQATG